tara:strand:+ start:403 stop:555 length:153 start_codon:yes stop_codon:yes gene_type:complete
LIIFNENVALYTALERRKFMQKLEESRKEIVDKIIKLKRQILNESANDFS